MNPTTESKFVTRGSKVSIAYRLFVDGVQIAEAPLQSPLIFTLGNGEVFFRLETALYGLRVGEEKVITVEPIKAYGINNPNLVVKVEKSELPDSIPLIPEVVLKARDATGVTARGKIISVDGNSVTIDYNHPLAGKTLNIAVKILEIS